MNEEQREEIKAYKIQIVVLIIVLIAIIISFPYLQDLINKVKYNSVSNTKLFNKNYLITSIFVFVSFVFILITYWNYLRRRDNETFLALLESIFLTIASLIRLYNIKKNQERY